MNAHLYCDLCGQRDPLLVKHNIIVKQLYFTEHLGMGLYNLGDIKDGPGWVCIPCIGEQAMAKADHQARLAG